MSFVSTLHSGKFIITSEISPPKGTDLSGMLKDADLLKGIVDAVNVTDNQRAVMRMSALATCSIIQKKGIETIMHITCRDRNRLALQSDILGAHALGIRNVLVMSGDHPVKGDHEGTKPVYDVDSVQLLGILKKLTLGFDLADNELAGRPNLCMGAVTNTELNEAGFIKFNKKILMGAGFFQTQAVFDARSFSGFMEKVNKIRSRNIKIIAGIIPLKSLRSAQFLNKVPGIKVPEDIVREMEESKDPEAKGIEIAARLIKEIRPMCDGVHIMPVGNHGNTKTILKMSDLL